MHVVFADGRDELGGLGLVDGSVVPVSAVPLDAQLQRCQLKLEFKSADIHRKVEDIWLPWESLISASRDLRISLPGRDLPSSTLSELPEIVYKVTNQVIICQLVDVENPEPCGDSERGSGGPCRPSRSPPG